MKNIYSIFTFILLLVSVSACMKETVDPTTTNTTGDTANLAIVKKYMTDNSLSLSADANNSYYYGITTTNPTGKTPQKYDLVGIAFKYYRINNGSPILVDSSRNTQRLPYYFVYNAFNSLLNIPTGMMKVGEKATYLFYSSSLVTEPMKLDIEIVSSQNETTQIGNYLKNNYPTSKFDSTSTGLRFLKIKENATGSVASTGKTVTVNYTGKLLYEMRKSINGVVSYNSQFDAGTFSFVLGSSNAIAGFNEGVSKLKVGEKGVIIFPSSLGYSTTGAPDPTTGIYIVPPSSPLLFEVEVTDVK